MTKSPKLIHNAEVGDLITDGYRFYVVTDLQSYNGYNNALMEMFCLEQCPNTGVWGYFQYSTTKHRYQVIERR